MMVPIKSHKWDMLTIDEIQKWATLGTATFAAIFSAVNFWRSLSANSDKIKVTFSPLEPPCEPGEWLYVVSQSDHRMELRDYGFIAETGNLLSLPDLWANDPGPDDERVAMRGSRVFEKRGALFEIGPVSLRDRPIGAFAITAGRDRYSLGFRDISLCRRSLIRLKIWWKPTYG
jgi:hypothetical protein